MRILYAVMILKDWSNYKLANFPVSIRQHPEMGKYFLPVFDSEEEAKKLYPEAVIQKIKVDS